MPWPNGAPRTLKPRRIPLPVDSQTIEGRWQHARNRIELVLSFDDLWRGKRKRPTETDTPEVTA